MENSKQQSFLSNLKPLIGPELKGHILENAEIDIRQRDNMEIIYISCKTLDDESRPSKRYQPIVIKLHHDFFTSELVQRPFSVISEEFTSFIRKKCLQFKPRTTKDFNEPHTEDYWVFPEEC